MWSSIKLTGKKCKLNFSCTELLVARSFNSNCYTLSVLKQTKALYRGVQILHKSRIHLKIKGDGKMSLTLTLLTWTKWRMGFNSAFKGLSRFRTENPQILGATWRRGFLYSCWHNIIIFINRMFWHLVFYLSHTKCFTRTIYRQLLKLH